MARPTGQRLCCSGCPYTVFSKWEMSDEKTYSGDRNGGDKQQKGNPMDPQDIAKQMQVEREMLIHIENALRAALGWDVREDDFSRNVSTLRFIAQSFQRHLNRAWVLQEQGGYMNVVLEIRPHLETTIEAMKRDHARLQGVLDVVILKLDRVSPSDRETFINLRDEFLEFLEDLKNHNVKETHLSQEAFMQEEGGEA